MRRNKMTPHREWLKHPETGALCLSGYPIRIEPGGLLQWRAIQDSPVKRDVPYTLLSFAKQMAERWADEVDEFAA